VNTKAGRVQYRRHVRGVLVIDAVQQKRLEQRNPIVRGDVLRQFLTQEVCARAPEIGQSDAAVFQLTQRASDER
jgi:hypothetical protein